MYHTNMTVKTNPNIGLMDILYTYKRNSVLCNVLTTPFFVMGCLVEVENIGTLILPVRLLACMQVMLPLIGFNFLLLKKSTH